MSPHLYHTQLTFLFFKIYSQHIAAHICTNFLTFDKIIVQNVPFMVSVNMAAVAGCLD